MAQSEYGNPGPIEVYADSQWDPMQGWDQELRFRGSPADLVALGNEFIAAGWRARTESTNSQWATLIVSIPNNGGEDAIDRYEFNIDFQQQDLWINAGINQYLKAAGYDDAGIVDLKHTLDNYIQQGTLFSKVLAKEGDAAANIFQMMSLHQTEIEIARPVLSRKRTYDIAYPGPLMTTRVIQDVFSTASLIMAFSLPAIVAGQITADPTATPLANTVYGWKIRKNNLTIIPAKNKIEEQVDFSWDQWSTLAYNYIP